MREIKFRGAAKEIYLAEETQYDLVLQKTHSTKNAAYGDSFSENIKDFGIADKCNRLRSLYRQGKTEDGDESIRDTLIDLAMIPCDTTLPTDPIYIRFKGSWEIEPVHITPDCLRRRVTRETGGCPFPSASLAIRYIRNEPQDYRD